MPDLKKQYKNADNLNARISIHRHSTNKTGFGRWIHSHYAIAPVSNVLELGCGTGIMWKDHLSLLDGGVQLTLTDFSSGMLESAKENLGKHDNLSYYTVDIQQIPFEDASFDVVIANMMLYHVPDLHQGLSEVRRVLKPGGKFYCATYGEHGISEYITNLLRDCGISDNLNKSFTLQNGSSILEQHFSNVSQYDYPDSLAIPDVDEFIDYIYSLAALDNIATIPRDTLRDTLKARCANGILIVPKEYGMFICE